MKKKISQRGYTLLFSVLTASLVLGVAAFIVGIARKQYIISATARDSMFSFYNADSALNCIMQSWNYATSTGDSPSITCNGADSLLVFNPASPGDLPTNPVFDITEEVSVAAGSVSFGSDVGCATYKIWVGFDGDTPPSLRTVMETRGYNVCDGTGLAPSDSPRTVERAIRLTQ